MPPVEASGTIKLTLFIDNERLNLRLNRFAESLSDMRRFWIEFFAPQLFADAQENFATEGRYVGGWRALSPAYAAWKLAHFGPKPILERRGRLKRSFTIGAAGNILRAFKTRGEFGSSVPYFPYHQRGTPRMPQRRILFFRRGNTYNRLLSQYVREELIAAGLPANRASA